MPRVFYAEFPAADRRAPLLMPGEHQEWSCGRKGNGAFG